VVVLKGSSKSIITEDKRSQVYTLLSGVMMAYAITCIIFIAYAVLLTYTSVTEQYISVVVTITGVISVVVAGYDAARGAESRGWLWGIAAGALYAVILLCIGAWVNKGLVPDIKTATLLILCLAGGGLGGVIGINKRN
jgi:putative membrane protein (TIGR04086 family)